MKPNTSPLTKSGTEEMMRSYCMVFMHPHSRQTVMIPAAPLQPLGRWEKVSSYIQSVAKVVLTAYF